MSTSLKLADAAPDLLDACLVVLAYLDKLESGDESDSLTQTRRYYHKPLRDKLEPAVRKAGVAYERK